MIASRSSRGARARAAATGAAAALTVAAAACGGNEASGGSGMPPTSVEAVVAIRDTLDVTVRSVGSLEAEAQVDLQSEAEGRVSRILAREGETVRRGQVLLVLDQEKLRSQLQAAEAAATRAQAEAENLGRQLERNRGLLETGAISRQAFDDLEASHDAAQARLAETRASAALARRQLADASVVAPFSGRTGIRHVDLGDYVREGDPLFTLVDDDSLEIQFSVPERYIGRLATGSPVTLRVTSHPDTAFEGTVSFVSPVVDPTNRSVTLKARVGNPARALRAGQFANVVLGLERRPDAILVPEAAIVPRAGQTFVFLIEGGQATERPVRVGERARGIVQIASGVEAGDTVIVAGQQKVREGSPVAPEIRPLREVQVETASGELPGEIDRTRAPGAPADGAPAPGADGAEGGSGTGADTATDREG